MNHLNTARKSQAKKAAVAARARFNGFIRVLLPRIDFRTAWARPADAVGLGGLVVGAAAALLYLVLIDHQVAAVLVLLPDDVELGEDVAAAEPCAAREAVAVEYLSVSVRVVEDV